jgi:hypothetical protein
MKHLAISFFTDCATTFLLFFFWFFQFFFNQTLIHSFVDDVDDV